ncbi:alkaline phosphatase D family protein [Qipengyuania thermophila]|uniref:alkaline phosphatase D family protein n=1 Tax=Qipengyuania thermophila TaxID=2509361 RepID=UPI001F16CF3C|nr:alkaline phosphatase D family protein [Qipengyuania thermophila]
MAAEDVLDAYFRQLERRIDLPRAPAGVSLASGTTLTRIAFGSCASEIRDQSFWTSIAAARPQLFMMIGDNVYGDTNWRGDAELGTLRASYARLAAEPRFAAFRAQVPMLATWDDHDFGFNDGGRDFAFRRWSQTIYQTFWDVPAEVRARDGVYESRIVGPAGRRVQIILLDTRFFRSALRRAELPPGQRPPLGPYAPETSADATMLGEAQWAWLEEELRRPADLRIVVSSIQVLTEAHNFESWATMPRERERLLALLAARSGGGLLLLSGDRHAGGIYRDTPAAMNGETVWELTSSSLNMPFTDTATNTAREPDPRRVSAFISEENFGVLEIDWPRRQVTLNLRGLAGEVRAGQTVTWTPPSRRGAQATFSMPSTVSLR